MLIMILTGNTQYTGHDGIDYSMQSNTGDMRNLADINSGNTLFKEETRSKSLKFIKNRKKFLKHAEYWSLLKTKTFQINRVRLSRHRLNDL